MSADRGTSGQPPRPRRTGGARGSARPESGRSRAGKQPVDPRRLAWEILQAVRAEDSYANLLLNARLKSAGLDGRDAGFVTELVAGTLRRQGTYDAILAACVARSLNRVDAEVLDILRLGAHQLLSMETPAHAVINTSVELARATVGQSVTGFVNAVLRKVAAKGLDPWLLRVAPPVGEDLLGHLATVHSHPRWVVEELSAALARPDELADLLAAHNQAPAVALVARPGRIETSELPGKPGRWSPYAVISEGGNPADIAAVRDGRAGVQDEGSQLVALALARAQVDGQDSSWLDVCAGPGGKAALLAALAAVHEPAPAGLLASERQLHRAALVASALRGARGVRGIVVGDGTMPPWRPQTFDRVLVDAPCSGLGALRRRPESRWRKRPDQVAELVELQGRLLDRAVDSVRPGGVVLYATCSPVLAETEGVVRHALTRPDVELEDVTALIDPVPDCAGPIPGTAQLWPHRHGTDAMFMALLRRR